MVQNYELCIYFIYCIKNVFTFIEPVGAKAPTFPTVSKISTLTGKSFSDIVLLCQAQAFPVPLTR